MTGIFSLVFVIVIGIIAFNLIKGISQWHYNNQQPVLSSKAAIVSKRNHVSRSAHNHNGHVHHHTSSIYYATFQFENGQRIELRVPSDEYGLMAEGDQGTLTYQGTRFHQFTRETMTSM